MGKTAKPTSSSTKDSTGVEALISIIRELWKTADSAKKSERSVLKNEIVDTINQLNSRLHQRVGNTRQFDSEDALLPFEDLSEELGIGSTGQTGRPRFPEPSKRIYDKDLGDHALYHLPNLADCRSIEEIRKYLSDNIRYNSQATRRMTANCLITRFFPGEVVYPDVLAFCAAFPGKRTLGDVLFYLAGRSEGILSRVAEEVIFPSLAQGGVDRARIRDFVRIQFPSSKSITDVGRAIVASYLAYGIGSASRTRLDVRLREGTLASFAYLLHLEFSTPGMHLFSAVLEGPMHKWLLWDQQWMIRQLYELREMGLISKVSEIDRLRQFTTKFTLEEAMPQIVAIARESPE